MRRRIIAIANGKGGVGKTTTAVNLAIGLAGAGHRTLLADMDSQGNATAAVLGPVALESSIYDVLVGEQPLESAIVPSQYPGMDVLPSDDDLSGAEVELLSAVGGQTRLRTRFRSPILDQYAFVIIDTPPFPGLLTINALAAADEVIIPVSAGSFALRGVGRIERTIAQVRSNLDHPSLRVIGALCTLYDHTNVARDVLEATRAHFGGLVFESVIPKNIKIEEAHSRSESIYDYAPDSRGSEAYAALVREILAREEEVLVHG